MTGTTPDPRPALRQLFATLCRTLGALPGVRELEARPGGWGPSPPVPGPTFRSWQGGAVAWARALEQDPAEGGYVLSVLVMPDPTRGLGAWGMDLTAGEDGVGFVALDFLPMDDGPWQADLRALMDTMALEQPAMAPPVAALPPALRAVLGPRPLMARCPARGVCEALPEMACRLASAWADAAALAPVVTHELASRRADAMDRYLAAQRQAAHGRGALPALLGPGADADAFLAGWFFRR